MYWNIMVPYLIYSKLSVIVLLQSDQIFNVFSSNRRLRLEYSNLMSSSIIILGVV